MSEFTLFAWLSSWKLTRPYATPAWGTTPERPSSEFECGTHACARTIRAHVVVELREGREDASIGLPVEVSSIGSVADRSPGTPPVTWAETGGLLTPPPLHLNGECGFGGRHKAPSVA